MPLTPVIRAPDEEQSAVGPFFESNRPVCGSSGVVALGPPLSGRPMPPSHAAVTIRLPAGDGAHCAAVPTNVNGTACTLLSSATAAAGKSPTTAATVTNTNTRFIESLLPCFVRCRSPVGLWHHLQPTAPAGRPFVARGSS